MHRLSRDTGVLINVERAVIDSSEGEALIDVPDDQCKLVRDTMSNLGAHVRILEHGINHNESEVRGLRRLHKRLPEGGFLV